MLRPIHIVTSANVQILVPRGWLTIISATSRKTHPQLITITNSHRPRMKIFLRNDTDTADKPMLDLFSGETSIVMPSTESQAAAIDLRFHHCTQTLPGGSWQNLDSYKFESTGIHVLNPNTSNPVFKTPDTSESEEFPDYITFIVFVKGATTRETDQSSYDLIVTIHVSQKAAPPQRTQPAGSKTKYDLSNIQGDIVPGLPKAIEYFYFFQILDLEQFRRTLKSFIIPKITTSEQLISMSSTLPPSGLPKPGTKFIGLNMGFSATGLLKLGLTESLNDEAFHRGQVRDAKDLGDMGTDSGGSFRPDWDSPFLQTIHGIFQITSHDENEVTAFVQQLDSSFNSDRSRPSIKQVLLFRASFRPPPETPNEHFGYKDGISKPEIEGITFDEKRPMKFPGSPVVDPGIILMGHEGDEDKESRPPWALDGSFFVFRKLKSYVPEFNDFLAREGPDIFPNIPREKAAARLGARLFGRWKSGTPIVLAPDEDDPAIAKDPNRLNNFDYDPKDQGSCPFAAHTRKSFPRSDIATSKKHLFRRQGIPYGPELRPDENHKTIEDRGLVFLAYQSSIIRGFKYIQAQAFSNTNFPPAKSTEPGHDPILGTTGLEKQSVHRFISGANPIYQRGKLSFPVQFVESRGGEYFFIPSMSTLREKIAMK